MIGVVFGLIFLVITPPFQSPDEINHFYKAYQISEGQMISLKQNDRVGGMMPQSLQESAEPFELMIGRMHVKTNSDTISSALNIPLKAPEKEFVDFPNTAMYSPVSYIPQSVGIWLMRLFDANPIRMVYAARLITLIFWLICLYSAIRITPVFKWLFMVLALLPMSVFVNMSLSADVVTNGLAFLLVAYILRLAYSDHKLTPRRMAMLTILVILLASAKLVYAPLVILLLLIPKRKFNTNKSRWMALGGMVAMAFATVLFWSHTMRSLYTPYADYNPEFRDGISLTHHSHMGQQIGHVLDHPVEVAGVFIRSMVQSFNMYFPGYIGTFGWLDAPLPMWIVYIAYIFLILVALWDGSAVRIRSTHKLLFVIGAIVMTALILLTQYLTWVRVEGEVIGTIQGRYFIPIFPLLFMLLYNGRMKIKPYVNGFIMVISTMLLIASSSILYSRYYIPSVFESQEIYCDAERSTANGLFISSDAQISLGDGLTQSKEQSRSGVASAKVGGDSKYAFTHEIPEVHFGDVLTISVWRLGTEGKIVVQGPDDFFIGRSEVLETDMDDWQKLRLSVTIPQNLDGESIKVFVFNNRPLPSFFDDMSITLDKLQ
jgi:uncharacterized membrane protein